MIQLTEEEIADTKQRAEAIKNAKIAEKIAEMDTPWEKSIVLSDLIVEKNFDAILIGQSWDMIRLTVQHYVEDSEWGDYYIQIYPDKYKHLMTNYNKIQSHLKAIWDAECERRRNKYEAEHNLPWWKRIF